MPSDPIAARSSRIWLGTAGWSYLPDWGGSFYPAGTSSTETFARYVEAFRFVEVDSTFYAAPAATTLDRWAALLPADSRISFKAPKELVQDTALCPPEIPFANFCGGLRDRFGERLARIVVQMPPGFVRTPTNDVALEMFAARWSTEFPLAIELRHVSWRRTAVLDVLRAHNVPLVGQDLRDVPNLDRASFNTSGEAAYIRLIGQHDGISKDRIQRGQPEARSWWIDRIGELVAAAVRDVYVVANNHFEGHAPETLRTMMQDLTLAELPVVTSSGWPHGQVRMF